MLGGKALAPIMKEFGKLGVHFAFKEGGGKATGGQDGWWAKTDIRLTENNEEKSTAHDENTEEAETFGDSDLPEKAQMDNVISDLTETDQNTDDTPEAKPVQILQIPYTFAELPDEKVSSEEYIAQEFRPRIAERAAQIIEAEAPILRDVLLRRIWSSYGVNKSNSVVEATEKALKQMKIKTVKQKGIIFCWASAQDPKAYYTFRVSNERSGDEICPQELRNAICYALQTKGEMTKDDLIKEATLALGYKRLGKNLEAALSAGVQYARSSGAIAYVPGGTFRLR